MVDETSAFDLELAEVRSDRREELLSNWVAPGAAGGIVAKPENLTERTVGPFLAAHDRVVVDVWAPWCAPCRFMAPVVDQLARELAGTVAFGKVNADVEPGPPMRWGIEGIPTFLLFDRGRLIGRLVGGMPREAFASEIRTAFRLDGGTATVDRVQ